MEIPEGLETKACVLGENILSKVPHVLKKYWNGIQPVIVADENTWNAAGKRVMELLVEDGLSPAEPVIFPANPVMHADYVHIPGIASKIQGKAAVAVGSGTINDLVKRASFQAGNNGYLCVATACSVDGYTSFGAAITVDGFKQTLPCPAPLAILADSLVLASAPQDMTASGYADLAAKIVAGADWHIADTLGETPMDDVAWNMVQTDLRHWLDKPEKLAAGSQERLLALFSGLAATGFAMQYYKESRPASGAEHLFSHVWEMDNLCKDGVNPSHGFKVAIGTLISIALMEETMKWSSEKVAELCAASKEISIDEMKSKVDDYLCGSPIHKSVLGVMLDKHITGEKRLVRQQEIVKKWDILKEKIRQQIFSFEDMKYRFEVMNCPVRPEQIGLDEKEFRRGIIIAAMIRKRYTILDLLSQIGCLEETVDMIIPRFFA